jgi:hypothetical protein
MFPDLSCVCMFEFRKNKSDSNRCLADRAGLYPVYNNFGHDEHDMSSANDARYMYVLFYSYVGQWIYPAFAICARMLANLLSYAHEQGADFGAMRLCVCACVRVFHVQRQHPRWDWLPQGGLPTFFKRQQRI